MRVVKAFAFWVVGLAVVVALSVCTHKIPAGSLQGVGEKVMPSPPADKTALAEAQFAARRQEMVEKIKRQGISNPDVLRAMGVVPRHLFVLSKYVDLAYENMALPIGHSQSISQPYIVAWMTELADLGPGDRVLEIGTGSGYQAAVLAELGYVEVYTIEIIPALAESGQGHLRAAGYTNVVAKQADGYYGWEEYAPFDAIIVTAAPDHLPRPLLKQLKDGGRMIIPIGAPGAYQSLWKFVYKDQQLMSEEMGAVRFVPFTGGGQRGSGGYEWPLP
jgi:protein-L-isoaspartate(D-aspartate) O-methyltransferase